MRRLTQLGALALKRSAYVLPNNDGTLEDFHWLQQEIRNAGGNAWLVEARFLAGHSDDELRDAFRAMRQSDYAELATDARAVLERLRLGGDEPAALEADRRRLVRRLEAVRRVDFFHAEGRDEVEALMSGIDGLSTGRGKAAAQKPDVEQLRGRMWVTRRGVKVDRMASAWLIRRFIDPAATFAFVAPDSPPPPEALRFDMFDGEFTHDGDRCTFEVLLETTGRTSDRGLLAIAQIVHDIDLRDERYHRPETAGVAAMVDGIAARFQDDHRRLAESGPVFDALYTSLQHDGVAG